MVKKILTVALALILMLGLAGTGMAASANETADETTVQTESEEEPVDIETEDDGLSQGAVHCVLTIEYATLYEGAASTGTMTLVVTRDDVTETFTAGIPWGLTDEEAMAYIEEAFKPEVLESFGLEVNSFKVSDYQFDSTTYVTTANLVAIHGKAPVRLEPNGKALGHTKMHTEMHANSEHHSVKTKAK